MLKFQDRFEKHFFKAHEGCWIWTSGKMRFGYGTLRNDKGRPEPAHRISYKLYVGDIPDGLCVLHKCDNPPCVNPAHLFLGTRKDNAQDMLKKNRGGHNKNNFAGHLNPNAKLTLEDKDFIENNLLNNTYNQEELAKYFCVHRQAIWRVCKERKLIRGWIKI